MARTDPASPKHRAPLQQALGLVLAACLLLAGLLAASGLATPVRAQSLPLLQLTNFELQRSTEGLDLSFSTRFELPRAVEEALARGVPLHFTATVEVYRKRWYWRDARVARAVRTWRLAWQPLTRSYRVSFGGLHQTFENPADALAALRGAAGWRIADARQLDDGADHYVEFSYRLDTDELPRPMQIGLAGQDDWRLAVERVEALP